MAFQQWGDADLASFLQMHGKDPRKYKGHAALAAKADKKHHDNPNILPRWIARHDPSYGQPQAPPPQTAHGIPAYGEPRPQQQAPPLQTAGSDIPFYQQVPYQAPQGGGGGGGGPPTYPAPAGGGAPAYPPAPVYPPAAGGGGGYPPPAAGGAQYPPHPSYPPAAPAGHSGRPAPGGGAPSYPSYMGAAAAAAAQPPARPGHGMQDGVAQGQAAHHPHGQTQYAPPRVGGPALPGPHGPTMAPVPAAQANVPQRRRKALLIGCNYPGTQSKLGGCVNDALCMEYMLKTKFGFQPPDIRVLRDDAAGGRSPGIMPTHQNILSNIQWLVGGCRPGDSLFFHFSGHGSQKRDLSGDEADGMNETICPTDYARAGQIVDDTLNIRLVRPICQGCVLHCVIDACHSGTALDLPFFTRPVRGTNQLEWRQEGRTRTQKGTSGGLAVQFGACDDSQTAADTAALSADRVSTGAATFLFIQAIEHLSASGLHNVTYAQVINDMLQQISRVHGKREVEQGRGMMEMMLLGKMMSAVAGGGGGGGGGGSIISQLLGGGGGATMGGQTPQLSASEPINLASPMVI